MRKRISQGGASPGTTENWRWLPRYPMCRRLAMAPPWKRPNLKAGSYSDSDRIWGVSRRWGGLSRRWGSRGPTRTPTEGPGRLPLTSSFHTHLYVNYDNGCTARPNRPDQEIPGPPPPGGTPIPVRIGKRGFPVSARFPIPANRETGSPRFPPVKHQRS